VYLINLNTTDPSFNLALEEYLLKSSTDDFFLIYINSSSVITGKHQVAHREADTRFITENRIPLYRRISGGGTVYHDAGNLNFTYIMNGEEGRQIDFRKYASPVISFLKMKYGIEASFEGKNDIKINGLKISGNAEHVYRKRILHHGTLLFNSGIDYLKGSLRKDTSSYISRAVPSNPSPVSNLSGSFINGVTMEEFRHELLSFFAGSTKGRIFEPPQELMGEAEKLAAAKFRTWEWNYAYGPEYIYNGRLVWNFVNYDFRMEVVEGLISSLKLSGAGPLKKSGDRFEGKRHMPDAIASVLAEEGLSTGLVYNFF
jgi:lipoate-protein ligase A